jgi:ABC-type transport system involved in multi-copper enzyme maturation permease subunit
MATKELRQSLRRGSFVIPFILIQFLAVAATGMEFQTKASASLDDRLVGMLNIALLWSSGPLWAVIGAICVVIMPMGGIILMGQELEEGNHELLLLTKLGRWKIVMGKFIILWGLCALTFTSLLPYVIARYQIGRIEWWYELACCATVLGASALVCAGVIGASAFRSIAGRIGVLALYLISLGIGCGIPLAISGMVTNGCGILYHLTAFGAVFCYSTMGLALARSRLRLVVLAYEVKPSGMLIALLVCAPFAIGMVTAISFGFAGIAGLVGMGIVAACLDASPKAPAWVRPPSPNIPVPPLPPETVVPSVVKPAPNDGQEAVG